MCKQVSLCTREFSEIHGVLMIVISLEHEKCARSIREFKWYINFEGRKLHRELEYERILSERMMIHFAF